MVEYYAMCSTADEPLHLRTILDHLGFRVNTTFFCDSVAARGIAEESWIRETQGAGGEDSVVARGCSRERATGQVDCFEGKQGGLGNESIACGEVEHLAESMWNCDTRRTVESYCGGRERIGP